MSIQLDGNWRKGFAFDEHTLSSIYLGIDDAGHDRYDTKRSEMGELVYQLKYKKNRSVIPQIIDLLMKFKGFDQFDFIIPMPASNNSRSVQPVLEIARELGNRVNVAVEEHALIKQGQSPELKNVTDIYERERVLRQHLTLNSHKSFEGKTILLLDDLFRSGSTLKVATEVLYQLGKAKDIMVLTMTKTRSNR